MQIPQGEQTVQPSARALKDKRTVGTKLENDPARQIKLQQASKDLEAIFVTYLFKTMEKTISENSLSGSKNTLSSMMFSSVMGQAVADQGGIGLANIIFRSLVGRESFADDGAERKGEVEILKGPGLSMPDQDASEQTGKSQNEREGTHP